MKPLLASSVKDFSKLRFPMIASPKLDGIRCLITSDGAVSRKLKPIPNEHIRFALANAPIGFDGELMTYTDGHLDDFNTIQSKVMSKEGMPTFMFHVFDNFSNAQLPYKDRRPTGCTNMYVSMVPYRLLTSLRDLAEYEDWCVKANYEGIMLRDPIGPYKFGRSTEREQILLKVKRFTDDEAIVIGKVERMHNENEAKKNALGQTERSSAKEGLVPAGTLGALQLKWNDTEFEVGTGFDDTQRKAIWEDAGVIGRVVTFKYQGVGTNGRPRFPVFKAFRAE